MSVLTGAAAAALYGSDAANGAIIITTKKGKEGRMNITVNSNVEFNSPLVMPRFQTRYGTGIGGVKDDSSSRSWGSKLTEARYFGYILVMITFKQESLGLKVFPFQQERK